MCRDEMTPLPTNDTDFVNHPVVSCLKSGKWVAKIQHPIRKVCVCVGIYSTPQEAADACTRKKLEYESRSEQEKAASFPTDVTNKHMGVRRIKSGNDASDVYNLSKLELDSQKMICSGKADAVYSTESATLKAADKRPVKADAEQSVKLYRPRHAYREKVGRWRTEIRHPIIKGKKIHLGSFDTTQEAANAYHSIRHDFELMFPGYKKIKQSNNSCQAEAFAEGNSDSTCVSGDPQAEEAYNNKMHEVDLIVRAHRKRTQYKGSCEAAAILEGTSNSTCSSGDPSVSTGIHLGMCTEEAEDAYNNTMHEFDLMVHAHIKHKQSKGSYKVDAVVESKCDPAFVSDEPSVSTRVPLGTFTEPTDKAYNNMMREFDLMLSCEADAIVEDKSDSACVSGVQLGNCTKEAEDAYSNEMREFESMVWAHQMQNQLKGSCEVDAIVEDKSDSACKPGDPSVSSNGSSVIKAGSKEEEAGRSVINVNVESLPVLITERRGEFDLGIIDSYGRLVGEYSRLDDELWIC